MIFKFARAVAAGLLLLILAACNNTLVSVDLSRVTMVAGSKCAIAKIADLPATIFGGHVLIPVTVDSTVELFVLDSGAAISTVTPDLVQRHKLRELPEVTILKGIGGITSAHDVQVKAMEIGGFLFKDTEMAVAPYQQAGTDGPRVAGLIGAPFLSAFDIEIDLPHRRVALYGSKHCVDGFLPWAAPYAIIGATTTRDYHLTIPVTVDSRTFQATFDTGAPVTLLRTDAAAEIGVTAEILADDRRVDQRGIGRSLAVRLHRFRRLDIGTLSFEGPVLEVGDALFDTPVLIGLDFLARHPVWLGYATDQIFIGPEYPLEPGKRPRD